MPLAPMISSVFPSAVVADERIVWLMVSPVAKAAEMIVVPSISPTTISAVRPRRRLRLRIPSRKKTRLRSASTAMPPMASARMIVRTTVSSSTGSPKIFVMALEGCGQRGVGDHDVVRLAPRG